MAKSSLAVKRKATLSAYEPSLREKAAILGEKGFKAVTGREPGYEARENINRYTGLLDLLEVPGAVLSANDAARNLKSKQYGAAAGDIAGLAAGAIPIAGGALKKGAKKAVKEGVEGVGRLIEKYGDDPVAPIGHNKPPATKLEILASQSRFKPPGEEAIVSQAGRIGLPLGGTEQMRAQHPSPHGPYARISPRKDPNEIVSRYEPMFDLPEKKVIAPYNLENSDIISLYGDKTRAGERLHGIGDYNFDQPVELHGGPEFGRMQEGSGSSAVWASEPSAVNTLRNRMRKSFDEGRDVYGVYTPMGPTSLDQTTMMTDSLLQMMKNSDVKKADLSNFDKYLGQTMPGLSSIRNPSELREQLREMTQGDRLKFTRAIDNAKLLAKGFPDVSAARVALTDPALMNMPAGATGHSVVKFSPDTLKRMENPTLPHGSYSEQMSGTNVGGFDEAVPFDLMFPDLFRQRAEQGGELGSNLRSLELQKPIQRMTPEVVDRIMNYRLAARRRR